MRWFNKEVRRSFVSTTNIVRDMARRDIDLHNLGGCDMEKLLSAHKRLPLGRQRGDVARLTGAATPVLRRSSTRYRVAKVTGDIWNRCAAFASYGGRTRYHAPVSGDRGVRRVRPSGIFRSIA